jgi:hypothetical protein
MGTPVRGWRHGDTRRPAFRVSATTFRAAPPNAPAAAATTHLSPCATTIPAAPPDATAAAARSSRSLVLSVTSASWPTRRVGGAGPPRLREGTHARLCGCATRSGAGLGIAGLRIVKRRAAPAPTGTREPRRRNGKVLERSGNLVRCSGPIPKLSAHGPAVKDFLLLERLYGRGVLPGIRPSPRRVRIPHRHRRSWRARARRDRCRNCRCTASGFPSSVHRACAPAHRRAAQNDAELRARVLRGRRERTDADDQSEWPG